MQIAEAAGRYAVELANRDVRPKHLLTPAAFDNAIRVLHAIGGSTNAVIHLVAIAGRLGIDLPLERFDELSRTHAVSARPEAGRAVPDGGLLPGRRRPGPGQ